MKSCKTRGSIGDIIYSIPLMRHNNVESVYITCDDSQELYCKFNKAVSVKPLLDFLGFKTYILHNDIPINIDFSATLYADGDYNYTDAISIIDLCNNVYNFSFDKTLPWLFDIPALDKCYDVVINRTPRYNNRIIELCEYANLLSDNIKIGFLGFDYELHELYKSGFYKNNIELIQINDMLDVAKHINSAKLFIGNGSSSFAVAEGLKTTPIIHEPRIEQNLQTHSKTGLSIWNHSDMYKLKDFIKSNNLEQLFNMSLI